MIKRFFIPVIVGIILIGSKSMAMESPQHFEQYYDSDSPQPNHYYFLMKSGHRLLMDFDKKSQQAQEEARKVFTNQRYTHDAKVYYLGQILKYASDSTTVHPSVEQDIVETFPYVYDFAGSRVDFSTSSALVKTKAESILNTNTYSRVKFKMLFNLQQDDVCMTTPATSSIPKPIDMTKPVQAREYPIQVGHKRAKKCF